MGLQEMRENMAYMTPTQAQIEAEDDARLFGTGFIKTLPDGTQARIDPREIYMTTPTEAQIEAAGGIQVSPDPLAKPAAEAGEQKAIKLGSWEQKIVNATIERCARELDRLMMRAAAAAIRAMKG